MGISGMARRLADVPKQGVVLAVEGPQQLAEVWVDVVRLVRRAGRVLDRVDLIVARLERDVDQAENLLAASDEEIGRLRRLLDLYQPVLQALAPLGTEAATAMKPSHLRGLSQLLDEIPALVNSIAPALEGMANLSPHMEDVTDRMTTVGQVVEGLPGAKRLRKRGQEREQAAE